MAYLTAWIPLTRQVTSGPARGFSSTRPRAASGARRCRGADLGAEVVATAGWEEKLALPSRSAPRRPSPTMTSARSRRSTSSSTPSAGSCSPIRSASSSRSAPPSRSASPAGLWRTLDPALLVGRNVGVQGFYLGRLMRASPSLVREAAHDLLRLWEAGRCGRSSARRFRSPRWPRRTGSSRSGARPERSCCSRESDFVTGGSRRARRRNGRLGSAVEGLGGRGARPHDGLRRHRPRRPVGGAWGPVEVACLNAGVARCQAGSPPRSRSRLYRRAMGRERRRRRRGQGASRR